MKEKKISLVLSEYTLRGGSGFELFNYLKTNFPDTSRSCFVLVTSNLSQGAVARAAEEDVDAYVLKPYTVENLQETLLATITAKLKPSQYIQTIDEGKKLIELGEYQKAIEVFDRSIPLSKSPTLGLFYRGKAEFLLQNEQNAKDNFVTGLNLNNIHYKCLVGLYDILKKQNKTNEAYSVVRKISKYFPSNPDRLMEVIRLAVMTSNFQDMRDYYDIFTQLETRERKVSNYVASGLYVSGKYFWLNGNSGLAFEYFEKVAISCSEFTKILRAIVELCIEENDFESAEKYLKRFSRDTYHERDFLNSEFLVNASTEKDLNRIVKMGLDLSNSKLLDPLGVDIMIKAMLKLGYSNEKIEIIREKSA